ncbi:MAG: hypothetical protein A3G49_04005 [Candidatus Sungbacteria bacterium RIFCSPLOWO2_12_FULL_41_11]|uniref:Excinuclease ABC subunit C n=1 Tax=Candidatus Sungbacteria bacterium RIFCSPLOWO2_12_FULL_41_11 TaxID=1802286 RepID=A0A1G2LT92_9BACT|nr:MAG: Excinuclease ABC subunit C [Parcubacteria group bacterium GW2011_GWA2_42_14]OGZ99301.1 MAG: hypothetical protein A3D41_02475 [Candidatus Sungbacteria bacterium RIFCSPHIGHO2_02_FULL_41_12b]OHA14827.1 MAG: hypothetical protein A3G49_04005 [Candidatus Sungbacteria bacterium RIFCSPLOWO2_12_FULL_41_11]
MNKPKKIPHKPGVYIFKDRHQKPLYIGKAGNLKNRLAFYFSQTIKIPKIAKLLEEAKKIQILETASEIEALIKEAELIKKYLPKYNVLMRDDKGYFYIGFTKEIFPKILITHQPDTRPKYQNPNPKSQTKHKIQKLKHEISYIGPFTDGNALKITLRLLRRIFPYCTCKETHKRPCLNAEIGRCPGYCCFDNNSKFKILNPKFETNSKSKILNSKQRLEYQSNIKNIMAVLRGKKKQLIHELKNKMSTMSKNQEFEKAAVLRDQLFGLKNIFEHRQTLEVRPLARGQTSAELENRLKILLHTAKNISRIEGYDISNISGTEATSSMVVFSKQANSYAPDKNQYRKFKIKTVHQISDVDMMREVITRRFNHPEWIYPDLIVMDGGKPQLNAATAALKSQIPKHKPQINSKFKIPIITALAKQNEELYIERWRFPIKLKKQPQEILHLFQRIRDESHRFAKKYHHKLREKKFKNG